ncbi:MAG: hypothetical protein NW224_02510 [Leptolyngbyaceae cyanobacterium bins.302]|nr:hypothetical protein [Leptolyngbyaceae cyanobacterium bins.302]
MANRSTKNESFFLPTISDLKSAQSAARQGTAVCILIIVFSLVVAGISSSTTGTPPSQWLIAALLIYGVIAVMIYRMSRVAAIAGLVLYMGDRLVLFAQQGISVSAAIAILFVFAFINAIRGTFAYHRLRQERSEALQEPDMTSNLK